MTRRHVGEWMTHHAARVRPQDPLFAALELMAERSVRHVLVMEGEDLAGIFSHRDVVRAALRDPERRLDLHGRSVAEVMTPVPLVTTWSGATLAEVAVAMRASKVGALPVLDDGRVSGIITTEDVLAAVAAPEAAPMRRPDL